MAAFYSDLDIKLVDDSAEGGSGLWELAEELRYNSDEFGLVSVPAGFRTDLASVPRWLGYAMFGNTAHKASVVHDWLLYDGEPRAVADREFYAAMKASGVPIWRAWLMWKAVRAYSVWHDYRNGENG